MLIDRLNYHGFDFDSLPDQIKQDIDLLTDLRAVTKGTSDQKLETLDLAIFESIEEIKKNDFAVSTVKNELEFIRKVDSNDSFNSKGLVELSKEQIETLVDPDDVIEVYDTNSYKEGGELDKKKTINIEDLKAIDTSKLVNAGNVKVGFRKNFLSSNILLGRKRNITLPNGENHDSYFAIVELGDIIASHNEKTFSSSSNYPKTASGRNINDRNYETDKNAQHKVQDIAQKLDPNLLISTSVESDGTPIINIDGIVVSGNNRTMSLKLAEKDFLTRYVEYLQTLEKELEFGGYGLYGMTAEEYKEKGFNAPVLVRIDTDFQSYTTEEMNKYNVDSKKSERPIDQAIRISQQLEDNDKCKESLINLVSTQETVSEINNSKESILRLRKLLLDCGLISENEISKYFNENQLSPSGKILYQVILSSLVLSPKSLSISQNDGIKRSTGAIVNAIIPAIKNKQLEIGNLNEDINLALQLINKAVSSDVGAVTSYISEPELFGKQEEVSFNPSVIAVYLSKGGNSFKEKLLTYNASMEQNQTENMFGDPVPPSVIFYEAFVQKLPFVEKILILRRFNEYLASIELSINDYESQLNHAKEEEKAEIKNLINLLVESRNFAI